MRTFLCLALVASALSLVLVACGDDSGSSLGNPTSIHGEVPTVTGEAAAILQVLQEYTRLREDEDATRLAQLFSPVRCYNRENEAKGIVSRWKPLNAAFDVRVETVSVQELTDQAATILPIGVFIQRNQQGELVSQPLTFEKEEGVWKITSCGLILPNTAGFDLS